jgi:Protein of unknown function (DUF3592)
MKLSVGCASNADPQNSDIERTIDERPQGADRHIHLQSNGDDYIEAFAEPDGTYRLAFVDRGRRFHTAQPVDADTAKTILVEYLNDDTDWRTECRFVPERTKARRSKAGQRISSEPPAWAVIVVAGAFFVAPLIFVFADGWLVHLPSGFGIVWLVAGPMVAMALAMLANKMIQARRASVWPQAAGRITRSDVVATRHQKSGEATEVTNIPAVEYEFSVQGSRFTGTRISIGEDTGGANTEATLAHYPVGAAVMVYYDPADPGNCVLEREIPKDVPKGCAMILAILAAVGIGGYWLVVHFLTFIEPYVRDGRGKSAVGFTIGGLIALALFFGSRFGAKSGAMWPVVPGKVMQSGTESYRTRVNRNTVTVYGPVVEYAYVINGHEYRSRQIQLDDDGDRGSREDALEVAARYPEGSEVEVHYDPANPGNAALERPAGTAWYLLAIAFACFAVAIYASRLLR